MAIYLVFSQQGLTTHTIAMSLRDDGFPMVSSEDAAMLPCFVPDPESESPPGIPRLERTSDGHKVAVAVAWQPGALEAFNADMPRRFIAGGRPCGDA